MAENGGSRQLQTIYRSCEIIDYLSENGSSNLSEIADTLDLTPGTVHTYLKTLEANGYVSQEEKQYKLGLGFVIPSERAKNQLPLYRAGKEETDRLAHEYDMVSHLTTEFNGRLVTLFETFGKDATGKKLHMEKGQKPWFRFHCTAAGKAILAHFPKEKVRTIISNHELPAYTSNTITDVDDLYDELEQIRDQGYSANREESMIGSRGVGAPIIHDTGEVIGSISLTGPANTSQETLLTEELPEVIMRAANTIEINLSAETAF